MHLGVNIDHVATVRQARKTIEPDPVLAAASCEAGGADGITVHLRQDRRHIQEHDVRRLREKLRVGLNLEMAVGEDVLDLALELRPAQACLVPENRQEITTEGGLRVTADDQALIGCIGKLHKAGILVSLFIEPDPETVRLAKKLGADAVELHTGSWANAYFEPASNIRKSLIEKQLKRLEAAALAAAEVGIRLHAGHGITYANVRDLLHLKGLKELNIGHSIVSRSIFIGMERAVREMKDLMETGPK
jgi:pyridoxine 5-phosphate synthase